MTECGRARGTSANTCRDSAQTCSTVGHARGPNYLKRKGVSHAGCMRAMVVEKWSMLATNSPKMGPRIKHEVGNCGYN